MPVLLVSGSAPAGSPIFVQGFHHVKQIVGLAAVSGNGLYRALTAPVLFLGMAVVVVTDKGLHAHAIAVDDGIFDIGDFDAKGNRVSPVEDAAVGRPHQSHVWARVAGGYGRLGAGLFAAFIGDGQSGRIVARLRVRVGELAGPAVDCAVAVDIPRVRQPGAGIGVVRIARVKSYGERHAAVCRSGP